MPGTRTLAAAVAIAALLAGLSLTAAGCGSDSKPGPGASTAAPGAGGGGPGRARRPTARPRPRPPKTQLPQDAGRAIGAFERDVYEPLRTGVFLRTSTRNAALLRARAAATLARAQLGLAIKDVRGKRALDSLVPTLTRLRDKLGSLIASLHTGKPNPPLISSISLAIRELQARSAAAGVRLVPRR